MYQKWYFLEYRIHITYNSYLQFLNDLILQHFTRTWNNNKATPGVQQLHAQYISS